MAKHEFEVIEGPTTITPPVDMVLLHKADYERLSTECSNLKLANDEARKAADSNIKYWHGVLDELESDILRRLREIPEGSMHTAPLGCTTSAVCAGFRSLNECRASSAQEPST